MVSMMEKHLEQLTEMPKVMSLVQLTETHLEILMATLKEMSLVC